MTMTMTMMMSTTVSDAVAAVVLLLLFLFLLYHHYHYHYHCDRDRKIAAAAAAAAAASAAAAVARSSLLLRSSWQFLSTLSFFLLTMIAVFSSLLLPRCLLGDLQCINSKYGTTVLYCIVLYNDCFCKERVPYRNTSTGGIWWGRVRKRMRKICSMSTP